MSIADLLVTHMTMSLQLNNLTKNDQKVEISMFFKMHTSSVPKPKSKKADEEKKLLSFFFFLPSSPPLLDHHLEVSSSSCHADFSWDSNT